MQEYQGITLPCDLRYLSGDKACDITKSRKYNTAEQENQGLSHLTSRIVVNSINTCTSCVC